MDDLIEYGTMFLIALLAAFVFAMVRGRSDTLYNLTNDL